MEHIPMILDDIKRSFSEELAKTGISPRSRRYSRELKEAVLAAIKNHGLSVADATKTLGISATAVSKWISSDSARADVASASTEQEFIAATLVPLQQEGERPKAAEHKNLLAISLSSGVKIEFFY